MIGRRPAPRDSAQRTKTPPPWATRQPPLQRIEANMTPLTLCSALYGLYSSSKHIGFGRMHWELWGWVMEFRAVRKSSSWTPRPESKCYVARSRWRYFPLLAAMVCSLVLSKLMFFSSQVLFALLLCWRPSLPVCKIK